MTEATPPRTAPRIVAIGSGKGGAGKTLLSANLGLFLATLGKRVAIVDFAFGSPNLHTFAGVQRPERTLAETMVDKNMHLSDALVDTPIAKMELISGATDPSWAGNPKSSQLTRLRAQVRTLDFDYVILDLASGTVGSVLDFFLLADESILVFSPEPPAVELGYRFLKSLFMRRLRKASSANAAFTPAEEQTFEGGIPAPVDILRRVLERGDNKLIARVKKAMLDMRVSMVLNNVRSKSDMDLGAALAGAVRRRMGIDVNYLGHLEYDDAVWVSLRRLRPLLVEHPESRVAKCVEKVTRRLLSLEAMGRPTEVSIGGASHYELLDVVPTASDEEIRRANRKVRVLYGSESVVVGGLYNRARLDELHERLDEAYAVLMDPRRRKEYDQALFPDGVPNAPGGTLPPPLIKLYQPPPPEDRPPMPELAAETEFTGALLKQVRQSRGLDLREISERTKIGVSYLASIENEVWNKLPAPVYVRGFLVEYAKMLGLPVHAVLESYLSRYEQSGGSSADA